MYCCVCMMLGVRESVVVVGSCDVLLGYSEVSGYDFLISELLVNLELKRFVVYQVSTDLVGALRVWASREIIKRVELRKGEHSDMSVAFRVWNVYSSRVWVTACDSLRSIS